MKRGIFFIAIGMMVAINGFSQEQKVTIQELTKYAEAMDSVNEMLATVKMDLADMVKGSNQISAARYNELSKIASDDAKLAEAKATPDEIAFIKEVDAKKEQETARINQTIQTLAKEYVTVPVFNKVKKALDSDMQLKSRYDSLINVMSLDNPHEKGSENH